MLENNEKTIQSLIKYISEFRHKAVVMREIHSSRAEKCRKYDLWFTFVTLGLVSATTFIGFSGIEIFKDIWPNFNVTGFNFLAFLVFFASLLNLVFRWKENHTLHFQGVVRLTHFILWLDKELVLAKSFNEALVTKIYDKYQSIIDLLPPNDNEDYIEAKKNLNEKSESVASDCFVSKFIFSKISFFNLKMKRYFCKTKNFSNSQEFLKNLIVSSPRLLPILKCMRDADERLWLGGGAVRNYVWDVLTGRATASDDLDVVFFEPNNTSKEIDLVIENKLINKSDASLNWSVKNQARMYMAHPELQVNDIVSAISNWPETATAIIVKLDDCDNLQIIAPHGIDDLLSLTIRPTFDSLLNMQVFNRRIEEKKWNTLWPELKVINKAIK